MFSTSSPRRRRRRAALAGVLLALGTAASVAAGSTGVPLSGSATDVVGDAPAGVDVRAFQASYSPTTGTLRTTVTMAGKPSPERYVTVIFGTRGAAGACGADGPFAVFATETHDVAWLPPPTIRAFPRYRSLPTISTPMSTALTDRTYRGQTWNCATAFTSLALAGTPIDAAGPATLVPGGRVATTPGSATILQLDHSYVDRGDRAHGRIPITVTCLRAATRSCSGRLTLVQQRSHRPLGHATFKLSLGTSKAIPVRVHLTPALKRLPILDTRVTVKADHGPSTWTVIGVRHAPRPTILRLPSYGSHVDRAHGRILVPVVCVFVDTGNCSGPLTLVRQHSHRPLGHVIFTLPLRTSRTIPIHVDLPPDLERLRMFDARVTVKPDYGPSRSTVVRVTHTT
jgi:hypothetical protein